MSFTEATLIVLASYGQPSAGIMAMMAAIPALLLCIVVLVLGTIARVAQMILGTIEETDR